MKKITLFILIAVVSFSCTRDNFLDFVPRGKKIPTTVQDYRELLDQVGPRYAAEQVVSRGFSHMHIRPVLYTDDVVMTQEMAFTLGYSDIAWLTFLFSENQIPATDLDADWDNYYQQIYLANVILDGLDNVEEGTTEEIAELQAEAKLHRAWAYLNLVNIYGLHYDPASAATDLGVPIREGINLTNLDLTRASVQEVYDYIINDITSSIPALPVMQSANVRFRPSQTVGYALLARTYLYQGRYADALTAADAALSGHDALNQYVDLLIDNPNQITLPADIKDDQEVIWYKDAPEAFFIGAPFFISPELYDLYEAGDFRRLRYVDFNELSPGDDLGLFDGTLELTEFTNTGIATPELLLISAECNARLGNTEMALARINELRTTRIDINEYEDVDITDPALLLEYIKVERRRELANINVRLFDIKRYNKFDNDGISVTHTYEGETVTLLPNSLNWAFPIANRYIQFNPEIVQNPRD